MIPIIIRESIFDFVTLFCPRRPEISKKAREYNRSKKVTWRDSSNGWRHLLAVTC